MNKTEGRSGWRLGRKVWEPQTGTAGEPPGGFPRLPQKRSQVDLAVVTFRDGDPEAPGNWWLVRVLGLGAAFLQLLRTQ